MLDIRSPIIFAHAQFCLLFCMWPIFNLLPKHYPILFGQFYPSFLTKQSSCLRYLMFCEKKKQKSSEASRIQEKIPARGVFTEMMAKCLKIVQDSVLGTDYRPQM